VAVLTVSIDDRLLDVERIHRWLSDDAYWSRGRSLATVERSLRHSVNVGAYAVTADGPEQVGLLRIVTDRATFAWVCDVYVDPARRGQGIGRLLLAEADTVLSRMGVNRALLATADAHGLYAEFGFGPLEETSRWMARSYAEPRTDQG
jgi:GNAT superfamily N-acetyltransferase